MADFDFDELDKAVTGALSAKDDDAAVLHDRADASRRDTTNTSGSEKPVPKVAPAMRRGSGRFMDVVHPSSDMLTKQQKVSRPTSQSIKQPADTQADEPRRGGRQAFELHDTEDASDQPLESPFLTDAKVEKRPLGAFSRGSVEKDDSEEVPPSAEVTPEEAIADHLNEEPEDPLLEAPDDPLLEAVNEQEPPLVESSRYVGAPQTEPLSDSRLEESQSESIGASSIPQQYTEQDSSAPASGAIFDTEAYHQPVSAPPAKRSSSFFMFIWILLLVILGAGAGVAFYLFVLPLF